MIRFDTKKDMEFYDNLFRKYYENKKEIERLNNIINELEDYFKEKDNDGYEKLYVEDILYKLKELKESDNNE